MAARKAAEAQQTIDQGGAYMAAGYNFSGPQLDQYRKAQAGLTEHCKRGERSDVEIAQREQGIDEMSAEAMRCSYGAGWLSEPLRGWVITGGSGNPITFKLFALPRFLASLLPVTFMC